MKKRFLSVLLTLSMLLSLLPTASIPASARGYDVPFNYRLAVWGENVYKDGGDVYINAYDSVYVTVYAVYEDAEMESASLFKQIPSIKGYDFELWYDENVYAFKSVINEVGKHDFTEETIYQSKADTQVVFRDNWIYSNGEDAISFYKETELLAKRIPREVALDTFEFTAIGTSEIADFTFTVMGQFALGEEYAAMYDAPTGYDVAELQIRPLTLKPEDPRFPIKAAELTYDGTYRNLVDVELDETLVPEEVTGNEDFTIDFTIGGEDISWNASEDYGKDTKLPQGRDAVEHTYSYKITMPGYLPYPEAGMAEGKTTIAPKEIWVVPDAKESTYHDSALQTLTYKVYADAELKDAFADNLLYPVCDKAGNPGAKGGITGSLAVYDTEHDIRITDCSKVGVYDIVSDVLNPLSAGGNYTITLTDGTGKYTVKKATPTYKPAVGLNAIYAVYGDTLGKPVVITGKAVQGELEVPGTFAWKDSTLSVGDVTGTNPHMFTAVFTPADLTSYEVTEMSDIPVYVIKKDVAVEWESLSLEYTGSKQQPEAYFIGVDTQKYTLNVADSYAKEDCGTYDVTAAFAKTDAKSSSYQLTGASTQYKIVPTNSFTAVCPEAQSVITHDGSFTAPTVTGLKNNDTVSGTVSYQVSAEKYTADTLKTYLAAQSHGTEVTVTWTFTATQGTNYTGTKTGTFVATLVDVNLGWPQLAKTSNPYMTSADAYFADKPTSVTYTIGTDTTEGTLTGTMSYAFKGSNQVGEERTVVATFAVSKDAANGVFAGSTYTKEYTVAVTKASSVYDGTPLSAAYGDTLGKPIAITGKAKLGTYEVTGSFAWKDKGVMVGPVNAAVPGYYTAVFTPSGADAANFAVTEMTDIPVYAVKRDVEVQWKGLSLEYIGKGQKPEAYFIAPDTLKQDLAYNHPLYVEDQYKQKDCSTEGYNVVARFITVDPDVYNNYNLIPATTTTTFKIVPTENYTASWAAAQEVTAQDGTFEEPIFIGVANEDTGEKNEKVTGAVDYVIGSNHYTAETLAAYLAGQSADAEIAVSWTFTPSDKNYTGNRQGTITFTVRDVKLDWPALNKTTAPYLVPAANYFDAAPSSVSYELSSALGTTAGTLTGSMTYAFDDTVGAAGSRTIIATFNVSAANSNGSYAGNVYTKRYPVVVSKAVPIYDGTALTAMYGDVLDCVYDEYEKDGSFVKIGFSKETGAFAGKAIIKAENGVLQQVTVPGSFKWHEGGTHVYADTHKSNYDKELGAHLFTIDFTPTDTANFETVEFSVPIVVSNRPLEVKEVVLVASQVYDGTKNAQVANVIFKGMLDAKGNPYFSDVDRTLTYGNDFTVSALFETPDVGEEKTATALVSLVRSDYKLETGVVTAYHGKITPAPGKTTNLTVTVPSSGKFGTAVILPALPEGMSYVTAAPKGTVSNNTLTFDATGSAETVTVTATGTNYENYTVAVTTDPVAITLTGLSTPNNLVHGKTYALSVFGTPVNGAQPVTDAVYHFSGTGSTVYESSAMPTEAGTYQLYVSKNDSRSDVIPFTIGHETVTVRFVTNGGTSVPNVDVACCELIDKPATARSGYIFQGWYKETALINAWNFETTPVSASMTLYAKWANETYTVQGVVTEYGNDVPADGATVRLMLGEIDMMPPQESRVINEVHGSFCFEGVAPGVYNLVVEMNGTTKTEMIIVSHENRNIGFVLPPANVNSLLVIEGEETPSIVVGGLDSEAYDMLETYDVGEDAALTGVKVQMNVKAEDEEELQSGEQTEEVEKKLAGFAEIRTQNEPTPGTSTKTNYEFFDIGVERTITVLNTGSSESTQKTEKMVETSQLFEIVIPYDMTGKKLSSLKIWHHHVDENGTETTTKFDKIDSSETPTNGTFYYDSSAKAIHMFSQKFSTYAIVTENEESAPPSGPSGPSGRGGGLIIIPACLQDSTCVYAKFPDADPKAWYHDGVHFCVEKGYMNGVDGGLFAPNGTLSRAMIVTILWRIAGTPYVNYAMNFADVAADQWYTEAIRWAQSTGVVKGYEDGTNFGPDDDVTREQLSAILFRYAQLKNYSTSARADLSTFADGSTTSEWALDAMRWANASGIVNGKDGNKLDPSGKATRAEAACMVQRFCNNLIVL